MADRQHHPAYNILSGISRATVNDCRALGVLLCALSKEHFESSEVYVKCVNHIRKAIISRITQFNVSRTRRRNSHKHVRVWNGPGNHRNEMKTMLILMLNCDLFGRRVCVLGQVECGRIGGGRLRVANDQLYYMEWIFRFSLLCFLSEVD